MHTPLKNQRHEFFCQHVANLESDVAAYKMAYRCSQSSAETNASRLRENEGVKRRIAELQRASATAATLTMQQRREWIARTVRLNLFHFDKERHGDLVEEIIEESGKQRIKSASKRACIMDDARLAGELKGDTATATATVALSGYVMTEAEQAELIAMKRAANERMIARRDAQPARPNGSNGHEAR